MKQKKKTRTNETDDEFRRPKVYIFCRSKLEESTENKKWKSFHQLKPVVNECRTKQHWLVNTCSQDFTKTNTKKRIENNPPLTERKSPLTQNLMFSSFSVSTTKTNQKKYHQYQQIERKRESRQFSVVLSSAPWPPWRTLGEAKS